MTPTDAAPPDDGTAHAALGAATPVRADVDLGVLCELLCRAGELTR